jgi:protein SCO1/2
MIRSTRADRHRSRARPTRPVRPGGSIALPLLAGMLAILLGSLTGCGSSADAARRGGSDYRGAVLEHPLPKPDFTLTATTGRPFHFRRETDGYLTLLYFGYTNCPDICPVHLANIAAVLHRSPYEVASRTKVVFVTTDPARDTLPRLRQWLDRFDPSFIGLRGTLDEVNRIQAELGLPPAVPDTAHGGVGHAAQVIAFSPDNRAHVVYPFGTRQEDWAHDLPKLVSDRWTGR